MGTREHIIKLSLSPEEYQELLARAKHEKLASYVRRILFDGAELRRADAKGADRKPEKDRAWPQSASAEMPTAPTPFERKSAKPLWKGQKGRLL
jgi:hypothetical protein